MCNRFGPHSSSWVHANGGRGQNKRGQCKCLCKILHVGPFFGTLQMWEQAHVGFGGTGRNKKAPARNNAPGGSTARATRAWQKHALLSPKVAILEALCAQNAPGRSTMRTPEALLPHLRGSSHLSGLTNFGAVLRFCCAFLSLCVCVFCCFLPKWAATKNQKLRKVVQKYTKNIFLQYPLVIRLRGECATPEMKERPHSLQETAPEQLLNKGLLSCGVTLRPTL